MSPTPHDLRFERMWLRRGELDAVRILPAETMAEAGVLDLFARFERAVYATAQNGTLTMV